MTFKKGDRVSFVDKYGILQLGRYEKPDEYSPGRSIVLCKAFADLGLDDEIYCWVHDRALGKEKA